MRVDIFMDPVTDRSQEPDGAVVFSRAELSYRHFRGNPSKSVATEYLILRSLERGFGGVHIFKGRARLELLIFNCLLGNTKEKQRNPQIFLPRLL